MKKTIGFYVEETTVEELDYLVRLLNEMSGDASPGALMTKHFNRSDLIRQALEIGLTKIREHLEFARSRMNDQE